MDRSRSRRIAATRSGRSGSTSCRACTRSSCSACACQGSADFLEDELRDRDVDVFLCGISGRQFTPRYVERIVARLAPRAIVPTHYDDFFRPLDAPARFTFNVNLTGFCDEVHRAAPGVAMYGLDVGRPLATTAP